VQLSLSTSHATSDAVSAQSLPAEVGVNIHFWTTTPRTLFPVQTCRSEGGMRLNVSASRNLGLNGNISFQVIWCFIKAVWTLNPSTCMSIGTSIIWEADSIPKNSAQIRAWAPVLTRKDLSRVVWRVRSSWVGWVFDRPPTVGHQIGSSCLVVCSRQRPTHLAASLLRPHPPPLPILALRYTCPQPYPTISDRIRLQ
jgi:hypothetical protein